MTRATQSATERQAGPRRACGPRRKPEYARVWRGQVERHGGVLLVEEVVKAGMPKGAVYRKLREESWQRLLPGAYAEPGEGELRKRIYAIQHRYPALVASHRSAAALQGLDLLADQLEVTAPVSGDRRGRVAGVRVYTLPLESAEVLRLENGLRVTSPARTVADLLRDVPPEEAVVAADCALRRGLATAGAVLEAVRSDRRRRGEDRALRALAVVDHRAQSPAESLARVRMREAGLRPECQVELRPADGKVLRGDFLFRGAGLLVEIEGYTYHGSRLAHQRDTHRFNQLSICAEVRRVLRFTAQDVMRRPQRMVRTIERALRELEGGGRPG